MCLRMEEEKPRNFRYQRNGNELKWRVQGNLDAKAHSNIERPEEREEPCDLFFFFLFFEKSVPLFISKKIHKI